MMKGHLKVTIKSHEDSKIIQMIYDLYSYSHQLMYTRREEGRGSWDFHQEYTKKIVPLIQKSYHVVKNVPRIIDCGMTLHTGICKW